MISVYEISIILAAHFIADFLFQNNWMASGKSNNLLKLGTHIVTYTFVLFFGTFFLILVNHSVTLKLLAEFAIISGILHFSIDFFTSKVTSWQRKNNMMGSDSLPNFGFFSTIGFDQLLHSICLFWIYSLLFK